MRLRCIWGRAGSVETEIEKSKEGKISTLYPVCRDGGDQGLDVSHWGIQSTGKLVGKEEEQFDAILRDGRWLPGKGEVDQETLKDHPGGKCLLIGWETVFPLI